jgi:hypothetical protein
MKVGLSNHQSICPPPPPLITSEPLGRFFMKYGMVVKAIQGDIDAIIFNSIAAIILKLLTFKFVK